MSKSDEIVNAGSVTGRVQRSLLATASLALVILASNAAHAEQVLLSSGPLGQAIPDNTAAGVTNIINNATTGTIIDVDLTVDINHTWVGDLVITLEAPDETSVTVADRSPTGGSVSIGSDEDLAGAYTFDDEAAEDFDVVVTNTVGVIPPGAYRPGSNLPQQLTAFDTLAALGDWSLTVSDNGNGDIGTLNSWSLLLTFFEGCAPAGNGNPQTINCDFNNDDQGNFDAGSGNDIVNINAGTFVNDISGGGDDDTLNINDGADVTGKVLGSSGVDTFNLNSGGKAGNLEGGSGNDIFNLNAGGEEVNVIGDSGNDTFNIDGATITGQIEGGSNNDTFNFRSGSDIVARGESGRDVFNVFASFQQFIASTTFDGGSNRDTVNLNGVSVQAEDLSYTGIENTNLLSNSSLRATNGPAAINSGLRVDSSSSINMQDGDASDQLTVSGFYGSDGFLLLDAELNTAGGSADRLVVNGDVADSGVTKVRIADVGDGSGSGDPITVVTVTGASPDDAFVLDQPVSSGSFQYDLLQSGLDWQLVVSELTAAALVVPSIQAIISGDNREIIGSLESRKGASFGGGREPVADMGNPYSGAKWGTWVRLSGNKADADGDITSPVIDGAAAYDSTLGFVQAGVSVSFWSDASSRFVASVFGHYADGDAIITDGAGAVQGTVETTSGGVGGSLTWLSTSGFYADLAGLASWHDIDTTSVDASGSTDGDSLAGSIEVGYSHRLSDTVNVVPQAQLVYQNTSIDGFTDSADVDTAFFDADHFEGRFGVAVEHVSAMTMIDGIFKANGTVSVLHDFDNDSGATVAGTVLGFDADGTELEVGGGLSVASTGSGFRFGFQSDYTIPLNDEGREGFSLEATAGINFGS